MFGGEHSWSKRRLAACFEETCLASGPLPAFTAFSSYRSIAFVHGLLPPTLMLSLTVVPESETGSQNKFFLKKLIYSLFQYCFEVLLLFAMYGCFGCIATYHMCAWCLLLRPEEGIRSWGLELCYHVCTEN